MPSPIVVEIRTDVPVSPGPGSWQATIRRGDQVREISREYKLTRRQHTAQLAVMDVLSEFQGADLTFFINDEIVVDFLNDRETKDSTSRTIQHMCDEGQKIVRFKYLKEDTNEPSEPIEHTEPARIAVRPLDFELP